jgi:outer membrane protein assembly factor BamB
LIKKGLAVGIILLFLTSSVDTMITAERPQTHTHSPLDCYHLSETNPSLSPMYSEDKVYDTQVTRKISQTSDDGPMDAPWSMYCHDVRHTGQSPYSTINTTNIEKWRYKCNDGVYGSIAISNEGDIYFGCNDLYFYDLYPNGTLKWRYYVGCIIESCPAVDENGTLYIGMSYPWNGLYAFYPNGTLKWRYGSGSILSSPAIGEDGVIYFGTQTGGTPPLGAINAVYPNGTLKWVFPTNHVVYSSPAIGNDGTIYCGCHDHNLYALYPNNGSLKWSFQTGDWIRVSPCIAEDGTIYCVSLDNYLYAVNPNGTMKWKTFVNAGTSPTIGQDGTIYAGWDQLYALNPNNGSIKWIFTPGSGQTIEGSTPAHSADGTIYFGTSDGGYLFAVNSDGSEKWDYYFGTCNSAPAIGPDGSIYIGTSHNNAGYLHAFGPLDPNAPTAPTITGQTNGKIKKTYSYSFTSSSPLGNNITYLVDWGDGTTTDWLGPYASGASLTLSHSWGSKGTYLIQARAKDTENLWGPWGTLSVTMPCSYETPFLQVWMRLLERFPNAFPVFRHLLFGYQ